MISHGGKEKIKTKIDNKYFKKYNLGTDGLWARPEKGKL
jgi:hypothetical protein